jgi:hypothetical protein
MTNAALVPQDEMELALQKNSKQAQSTAVQTSIGRYTQEVQGMMIMAKRFPRDQYESWQRIKEACSRKSLAEVSQYTYRRGGQNISGPSIRLAEVIAQSWGNISHGVVELEQKYGESTAMAFAWDLETNTRAEKIFTVKHEIKLKDGSLKKLSDPRDIYELVANYGARRQRNCILSVIPKDITDKAVEECDKTLLGDNTGPISDRIMRMLDKFKDHGVTKEMIEARAGYRVDIFTEQDLLELSKVYNSLKDGMGKREDYFEVEAPVKADNLAEEFEQVKRGGKSGAGKQAELPQS